MPQATLPPILVVDGSAYSIAAQTGTLGAALAANSVLFAMRTQPAGGTLSIAAMRIAWTTIVAFTTPLTAGRAIGVYRATAAPATGGTAVTPVAKSTRDVGGDSGLADVRIAAAAGLTKGAMVIEPNPIALLDLASSGAAGARVERSWLWASERGRVDLAPGELLVVSNPAAMDAAGTFQLAVEVDYTRRDL